MNLIEELRWRGMIQDIMPGTEEQLLKEPTAAYIGFDPTADSLHIGSLVPIILLVHLQRAGHKPVALVGGATGMVGDPSGKSAERNLLDEATLDKNVAGLRAQLGRFLDFSGTGPTAAELVNNYDWFKGLDFLSFIRDAGKHITVNYMMAKDSVKRRLEGDSGLSFTEFTYQLIQGYDFYWLYQNKGVKLQAGGSDQWGNITTGTELVRRKAGGEAFAFTCPLIKKADGTKFGKTEAGNVWLDAGRTSPYEFYQFWINATDEDVVNWIRIFTFLPQDEINALIAEHDADRSKRVLQKRLAEELTVFVHGKEALAEAIATTQKLFDNASAPAESLSVEDLESLSGIQKISCPLSHFENGTDIVSFVTEFGIYKSKRDARERIQGGGLSLNRHKSTDINRKLDPSLLLHGQYLLVNEGKKKVYLVKAE
ncbi:tyrosine--tRNA ligase [Flaviaesturariibacter amylovorans]|uniref:Tyrosine--tRNA ligase n=1 Tax=Flaviaesturariibacter amylovorans TaxID=1084520 RepID=A0ABP8GLU6_9BACT